MAIASPTASSHPAVHERAQLSRQGIAKRLEVLCIELLNEAHRFFRGLDVTSLAGAGLAFAHFDLVQIVFLEERGQLFPQIFKLDDVSTDPLICRVTTIEGIGHLCIEMAVFQQDLFVFGQLQFLLGIFFQGCGAAAGLSQMPPSPVAEETRHRIAHHTKRITVFGVGRRQQWIEGWWEMPEAATVLASVFRWLWFKGSVDKAAVGTRPTAAFLSLAFQPVVTHAPEANILFDFAHGDAIPRILDNLIVSKSPCDETLDIGASGLGDVNEGQA